MTRGMQAAVSVQASLAVLLIFPDHKCVMIATTNPPVRICPREMPMCSMCRHARTFSLPDTSTHLLVIWFLTPAILR